MITFCVVIPSAFYYTLSDSGSVNGSSPTGHCSGAINSSDIRCLQPTTSVLFDGNIPTLIGSRFYWASQLFTLQAYVAEVIFDFSATPGYVGIDGIEVVLFNCPPWGISTSYFEIRDGLTNQHYDYYYVNVHACDTLVKVCAPLSTNSSLLSLRFWTNNHRYWVHLAEVSFYRKNSGHACQPLTIINDQSLLTTTSPHPTTLHTSPLTTEATTAGETAGDTVPPQSTGKWVMHTAHAHTHASSFTMAATDQEF